MSTFGDFLTSGRLGTIALGDSEEKVRRALGEPRTTVDPGIWEYDGLSVKFERTESGRAVFMLLVKFSLPEKKLPNGLGLTGWVPTPDLAVEEFKRNLATLGIKEGTDYQTRCCNGGSEILEMTSSGVRATFLDGMLASIMIVASAPKHSKGRQLAVFVPEDVIDVVRKEAAQRKVSISALCSEWITEHARSVLQH
jgi:hypothetical protein